ncbi:unnamed protein product [Prunus armeniaca]|uniref:RNase H type-1 domain-containing protein n=1 Tax=Prunus armeniaca TaxID=36596 RepID=A0A6J5W5M2_PRUAR|nr:unnamed protein product [Prunus armeniaca]
MGIKGMCIIISKLNVYGAIDNTTGLRNADFFHLLMEIDSSEAIMMINLWEIMWANVSNIVDDVRDLLVQFSLKEVKFQPRECN